MKKILIIVGSLVILGLLGIFIYLYSQDGSEGGVFANLGFGDTTDETVPSEDIPVFDSTPEDTQTDVSPLRQLTTTPVTGYAEAQRNASSSPEILYTEAGTSHVYRIDSVTYESQRLSNTTITDVSKAVFSADGRYVALLNDQITILTLPASVGGDVSSFSIFEEVEDIEIVDDQLLYLVRTAAGAAVKQYGLGTKLASETLFTIPFREVAVAWGSTVTGPHYYYPKPAADLLGYLYSWEDGAVSRENISGFGLTATVVDEYLVYTPQTAGSLVVKEHTSEQSSELSVPTLPEKCSGIVSGSTIICGLPENYSSSFIQDWRKGVTTSSDRIQAINLGTLESRLILDPSEEGLDLDLLYVQETSRGILFRDGATNFLWEFSVINR